MKLKKYVLFLVKLALVIATLVVGLIIANYLYKESGRGAGGCGEECMRRPSVQAGQVASPPSWVKDVIIKMIAAGSAPENITFTGTQSPDDVFGSGGISAHSLTPPPAACSPPCSDWKFLPAAKKDYGWYVYGVGTSATDIIAYLPGITPAVCSLIQREFGYKSLVPPKQAGEHFDPSKPGIYSAKGSATTIKSEDTTLDGQPYACFYNHVGSDASSFSYYFVMLAQ